MPDGVTEERVDLLRAYDKQRVLRWRYAGGHGAFEAHISVGWLPDGRWWAEDTRGGNPHVGWVFTGPPEAARAAAEEKARERMAQAYDHGGRWEPTIATYEPGVMPGRAAVVPDWPPGFGPQP